ncbi:unnamed protein product [Knipowitschia caucasica]|uniref:G-protein coupled receptors family 1 profile domain-containing protein n=1 Tax=Knipowitschia caucasica TaxID=637954 RepID=A0AAV2J4M0_KNICA
MDPNQNSSNTSLGSSSSSARPHDKGERLMLAFVTSVPCGLFFFVNGCILSVLRSKPQFSQCPRYVLLFNLVFADTVLMAQGQMMYLLATYQVWISYPLCIFLNTVCFVSDQISPYTLIFMSLERCVAVCFPFRHSTVVTLRNTHFVIMLTWAVSTADVLVRVILLMEFPFHLLPDLQMRHFCSTFIIQISPKAQLYHTLYTYFLFTLSAVVISSSFVAVMVVACLASDDKAQAEKTRNTLLLHMFQLGLNLLSVMNMHLFVVVSMCCNAGVSTRLLILVYVCVVLMPRCLSALTYGLRDPTLRPALGAHVCCGLRLRAGRLQLKGRVVVTRH